MKPHIEIKSIRRFSQFLRENYGVHYSEEKTDSLQIKLKKLMDKNGVITSDEYYELITGKNSKDHLKQFLDVMTTHTTNFFREINHFDFLEKNIDNILKNSKRINSNREIRVWSSACSTGQEPYTVAMVLNEILPPNIHIKILATDISSNVVDIALKGLYSKEIIKDMEAYKIKKYFEEVDGMFRVSSEIKEMVTFRIFNLMEPFNFKKKFDIIFCRNVMIYFEQDFQVKLVEKMYDVLVPGGLLFIGHSESLSYRQHRFKYIQPSVYMKV